MLNLSTLWKSNSPSFASGKYFELQDGLDIYRIYISKMTEEPAFEQVMDIATPISFSTIVSTASIKETELRGLIEKCIMLDKQIEDAKKPKTIEVVQPQNQ